MLGPALLSMQGTASQKGMASVKNEEEEEPSADPFSEEEITPDEELGILEARLQEAVREEDYEAAARYRDEIRALREKQHG